MNWDQVIALTGLSSIVTTGVGFVMTMYISSMITRTVDQRLEKHTREVLGPMLNTVRLVELEQARIDERLRGYDRKLECGNFRPQVQHQAIGD